MLVSDDLARSKNDAIHISEPRICGLVRAKRPAAIKRAHIRNPTP